MGKGAQLCQRRTWLGEGGEKRKGETIGVILQQTILLEFGRMFGEKTINRESGSTSGFSHREESPCRDYGGGAV